MKKNACLMVIGGAGFIGSSFVRIALKAGYRVVVVDKLTYAGNLINLEGIIHRGKCDFEQADICNSSHVLSLLRKYKVDAIVNLAAESHVDRSISSPLDFVQTNVVGVVNLLIAIQEYWEGLSQDIRPDFRLLQVSTDEVYGSLGEKGYFTEKTPYDPKSPYSASKAAGDHFVMAWCNTYGLPAIITNCSNNYGPRQYPEKLIPVIISLALADKPLPIYGDGKNIRDWIYVDDHSAGILLALMKGKIGETYCFGGDSEWRNIELVNKICGLLDIQRPRSDSKKHSENIEFVTDRLGHDRRYAIDFSKAKRELGYANQYTFEEGLAKTVDWYLNNPRWLESIVKSGKKD